LALSLPGAAPRKKSSEFSNNIDFIDLLPPGLYEAKFEPKTADTVGADLLSGQWGMRCEFRTLDDIRAFGGNNAPDERRFAAAAKLSDVNLALYRTFVQPFLRAAVTPEAAEWMKRRTPLRLPYEILSDSHPSAAPIESRAAWA